MASSLALTVPLSDPGQPVFLDASLLSGSLSVEGYDGSEVVIQAEAEEVDETDREVDGMRRIPNTSLGLSIEEQKAVDRFRKKYQSDKTATAQG